MMLVDIQAVHACANLPFCNQKCLHTASQVYKELAAADHQETVACREAGQQCQQAGGQGCYSCLKQAAQHEAGVL